MVGAVKGSVSMTKAKKKSGVERSASLSAVPYCDGGAVASTVARLTRMKVATRSSRCSLRTSSPPPIRTTAKRGRLPATHQVAGWLSNSPVSATPRAAGLNRCFLPIAKMYLDEMAHTEAAISTPTPLRSIGATGSRMRTRIRAVM